MAINRYYIGYVREAAERALLVAKNKLITYQGALDSFREEEQKAIVEITQRNKKKYWLFGPIVHPSLEEARAEFYRRTGPMRQFSYSRLTKNVDSAKSKTERIELILSQCTILGHFIKSYEESFINLDDNQYMLIVDYLER